MKTFAWMTTAALGLLLAPSVAHAHGPYLEQVSDSVTAEFAAPACDLPGMTCGLCHQPVEGDRLENIVVGFEGIETTMRNGPFYDSVTGEGGWMHSAHMGGGGHIDENVALLEMALGTLATNGTDSDMDGVGDLEELSLGYNPLLPYEEADPERSQLCGNAGDFPDVGGGSTGGEGSTGGDESTGGNDDTTGGNETGGATDDGTPATDDGTPATGGSGGSGSGGETGASDDGGSGCRIGGTGTGTGALGLLMLMGLVARRRRRD